MLPVNAAWEAPESVTFTLLSVPVNIWKRLKEPKIKESGPMLPSRIVLDYRESDGTYRTFVEVLPKDGPPKFHYGRLFYSEDEAVQDFHRRAARQRGGPGKQK
jgi:hypothetical protein